MSEKQNDRVIISYVDFWELAKQGPTPKEAKIAIALSFITRLFVTSFGLWFAAMLAAWIVSGKIMLFEVTFFTLLYRGVCLIDHGYESVERNVFMEMTNRANVENARPVVSLTRLLGLLLLSFAVSIALFYGIDYIQGLSLPSNIVKF